jgi:hypothetical protein
MTRIVQIVWLIIAAVCIGEASYALKNKTKDQSTLIILFAVAALAITRFILLRRRHLKDQEKL